MRRIYTGVALGLIAIHTLLLVTPQFAICGSDVLIGLCALAGCLACIRRARRSGAGARWKWMLVSAGLAVWVVGQMLITWCEVGLRMPQAPTAIASDFYFFLFGIPVLLAIASGDEGRRAPALLWIDGLQAALAVYLVHLELFPRVIGSSAGIGLSALWMTYAYNTENLVLALAVSLRLMAKPRGEDRSLYRSLFGFLCLYTPVAAILNYLAIVRHVPTGTFLDLCWDLPFLLLGFLATRPKLRAEERRGGGESWIGLVITNVSPMFFTMALLVMSVSVARTRFLLGVVAMLFALLSYGLRNSLLQSQLMRTERKLLASEVALREANEQLEELSFQDALTGIPNRRRFETALVASCEREQRTRDGLSLLVVDIDHFKLLNDEHGHPYGDDCLVDAARALTDCLRAPGQMLARYGGEEFAAILPGVGRETAMGIAEDMREAVERKGIPNSRAPGGVMTVSIGVAVFEEETAKSLFAKADEALYLAKAGGRNAVHCKDAEQGRDLQGVARLSRVEDYVS